MSVTPDLEAPRAARSEGFSDAFTVAFADPAQELYGTARLGLAGGARASGLVVLFHRGEVAAVAAEGGTEAADPARWEGIGAAGIDVETVEPLRAWRLSFAGEDVSFDLELEATGPACALDERGAVAKLGGMHGYEQPLRVRGAADVSGAHVTLDGLGQRGRSWGEPDWTTITRVRTASAWFGSRALTVSAIAAGKERGHGEEAIAATVFGSAETDCAAVEDTRLSTTFDADGRQRHASVELWLSDEGPPLRAGGEVVCGTTLDLGRLRFDTAFLHWTGPDGEPGTGRYDILRRSG